MRKTAAKSVSGAHLARVFGCTPQWISQLVQKGLPKQGRDQYLIAECLVWYVRFLKKALDTRGAGPDDELVRELRREKIRRARADAEMAEIELHKTRGQLVPIEVYESHLGEMVLTVRARLLDLPNRYAAELEGLTRVEIKHRLKNAIYAALTALATRRGTNSNVGNASMKELSLTTEQIAEDLNVPTEEVKELVNLGMPVNEDGTYDRYACQHWYIKRMHAHLELRAQMKQLDEELRKLPDAIASQLEGLSQSAIENKLTAALRELLPEGTRKKTPDRRFPETLS